MADFCAQCSTDMDFEGCDLKGLLYGPLQDGYAIPALCEGCGYTMVDLDGNCVNNDCLKKGHKA